MSTSRNQRLHALQGFVDQDQEGRSSEMETKRKQKTKIGGALRLEVREKTRTCTADSSCWLSDETSDGPDVEDC